MSSAFLVHAKEGYRVHVVVGDVIADDEFQLLDATKESVADAMLGDVAEPAFDRVEPGAAVRGEVDVEVFVFL